MTTEEAIKILEVAKAECEWSAPLEYQEAFNTAIYVLQNSVSYEVYKQVVRERDIAVEQLKELGYELGEEIRKDVKGEE